MLSNLSCPQCPHGHNKVNSCINQGKGQATTTKIPQNIMTQIVYFAKYKDNLFS